MILRPEQLSAHLEKPLAPLYLLHGNEPLLVLEAADAIRAAARRQGYTEREVLVAGQGFRWDSLQSAAGNLSLFGESKLVDLRIPNGKPGREGGEALQRHARQLDSGIITLVTLPELDWTARKASWFTALTEAGVCIELNAPERERLPDWIGQRLARQQQKASAEGLAFIAEHVEGNLLAAHQEILKLGLLQPPGELDLDTIRSAVLNVARYDIDSLRTALLEGDPARCSRLLDGLRGEGEAPPLVLWALTTEVRSLARLRAGLDAGQPAAGLFKAERIYDERRRQRTQKALGRLSAPQLQASILHAAKIDRMIKGLADGDVWDEFLMLCLRLTRHAPATPRR